MRNVRMLGVRLNSEKMVLADLEATMTEPTHDAPEPEGAHPFSRDAAEAELVATEIAGSTPQTLDETDIVDAEVIETPAPTPVTDEASVPTPDRSPDDAPDTPAEDEAPIIVGDLSAIDPDEPAAPPSFDLPSEFADETHSGPNFLDPLAVDATEGYPTPAEQYPAEAGYATPQQEAQWAQQNTPAEQGYPVQSIASAYGDMGATSQPKPAAGSIDDYASSYDSAWRQMQQQSQAPTQQGPQPTPQQQYPPQQAYPAQPYAPQQPAQPYAQPGPYGRPGPYDQADPYIQSDQFAPQPGPYAQGLFGQPAQGNYPPQDAVVAEYQPYLPAVPQQPQQWYPYYEPPEHSSSGAVMGLAIASWFFPPLGLASLPWALKVRKETNNRPDLYKKSAKTTVAIVLSTLTAAITILTVLAIVIAMAGF